MESFEYAIIRVVPAVEREEFLNVGVVLYCKNKKYLGIQTALNQDLLSLLCPKLPFDVIQNYLDGFISVSNGSNKLSPISQLDIASRFRWLTAMRSTMIQTSRIHTGITADPEQTLQHIFKEQVCR